MTTCPRLTQLAFFRCGSWYPAGALSVTNAEALPVLDSFHVKAFLNPRSPPGWLNNGKDLDKLCYQRVIDRCAVATFEGPAYAASILRWLRASRPRNVLLQRQQKPNSEALAGVYGPLALVFNTLILGRQG
ncbi:hypothetical protein MMPV_006659 [Pyropia vietnamensis]